MGTNSTFTVVWSAGFAKIVWKSDIPMYCVQYIIQQFSVLYTWFGNMYIVCTGKNIPNPLYVLKLFLSSLNFRTQILKIISILYKCIASRLNCFSKNWWKILARTGEFYWNEFECGSMDFAS